jgi:hypothetical protein
MISSLATYTAPLFALLNKMATILLLLLLLPLLLLLLIFTPTDRQPAAHPELHRQSSLSFEANCFKC